MLHGHNQFKFFAQRGTNEKFFWLSAFVRPVVKKSPDTQVWANFVRKNVRDGRETWSCSFCKCNPNDPSAAARADPKHNLNQQKDVPSTLHALIFLRARCSSKELLQR